MTRRDCGVDGLGASNFDREEIIMRWVVVFVENSIVDVYHGVFDLLYFDA